VIIHKRDFAKILRRNFTLALGISILVAIVPTAKTHNIGYVDPNLYIGYATNLQWLVGIGGFEYHATRLPFIGFVRIILLFGPTMFGLIYKVLIVFFIALVCIKLSEQIKISRGFASLLTIFICLSPMVISISSWTMPNGFAAVFTSFTTLYIFRKRFSNIDLLIVGSLMTTSFMLNAFGSVFAVIPFLVTLWMRSTSFKNFFLTNSLIGLGILFSAISYQLIWTYALKLPNSLWEPHINVIFNRDSLVSNWLPISSPTSQGVSSFLILGFSLIILLAVCKMQEFRDLLQPVVALITTYVFVWVMYFAKLNFAFNAFWYYYAYLPMFLLTSIITLKVLLVFTKRTDAKQENSRLFFAVPTLLFLALPTIFLLHCKIPSLMTAYKSSSNYVSTQLLEDEIALNNNLRTLPRNRNSVATWYEPDATGYRGSLISSTSFHLVRFEGAGENQDVLDFRAFARKNGVRPSCLAMITSPSWVVSSEFDLDTSYSLISENFLPSKKVKLSIFCGKI